MSPSHLSLIGAILFAALAVVCHAVPLAEDEAEVSLPPFLEGESDDKIGEFYHLLADAHTKTDDQVRSTVEAWIKKQSDTIKKKFAEFNGMMEQRKAEAESVHAKKVAAFSPEAKAADKQLSAIAANKALTALQKGEQIAKIISALPPTVRAEIEKGMKEEEH